MTEKEIIKKYATQRAEGINDKYILSQLLSSSYLEGYDWRNLPEYDVFQLADSFYSKKLESIYSEYTHSDLFVLLYNDALNESKSKVNYLTLTDLIYDILDEYCKTNVRSYKSLSSHGVTKHHISQIVNEVRDDYQYNYRHGNIDYDTVKEKKDTQRTKQHKDYGKLWLGVLIAMPIIALAGMSGSFIIFFVVTGITLATLSATLFKDLDV